MLSLQYGIFSSKFQKIIIPVELKGNEKKILIIILKNLIFLLLSVVYNKNQILKLHRKGHTFIYVYTHIINWKNVFIYNNYFVFHTIVYTLIQTNISNKIINVFWYYYIYIFDINKYINRNHFYIDINKKIKKRGNRNFSQKQNEWVIYMMITENIMINLFIYIYKTQTQKKIFFYFIVLLSTKNKM